MKHSEKTLHQLLDEAGINRITEPIPDSKMYTRTVSLEYKGKVIDCPTHDRCYEVVLREFGIDFTTFNN